MAAALLAGTLGAQEWTTYGGNPAGWRYSPLSEINTGTVARLSPKWIFQTRVPGNLETSPLVMGGMMYMTAPSNHGFALDLRSGRPVWHYAKTPPGPLNLCCGEVNRGFAAIGDRLFKVNIEDTLVALDRNTGKVLWETEIADHKKGYSGTVAPLAVKNLVLVGTAPSSASAASSTLMTPAPASACGASTPCRPPANPVATPGARTPGRAAAAPPGSPARTIPS